MDDYEIIKLLGHSIHGTVYLVKAKDDNLEKYNIVD